MRLNIHLWSKSRNSFKGELLVYNANLSFQSKDYLKGLNRVLLIGYTEKCAYIAQFFVHFLCLFIDQIFLLKSLFA